MDDYQIIELYWQRSEHAISATAEKYGSYCFSIAENILLNRQDSEECVNDTWLNAWNAIPPAKPHILKLFLARITRNLSINRYHERNAKKRGGGQIPLILDELAECIASESDMEQEYIAKELGESVRNFVKSLSTRDAKIFVRRYFYAEAISTIGIHYHLSENHIAVILSRIREKLRTHLEKEGFFGEQN